MLNIDMILNKLFLFANDLVYLTILHHHYHYTVNAILCSGLMQRDITLCRILQFQPMRGQHCIQLSNRRPSCLMRGPENVICALKTSQHLRSSSNKIPVLIPVNQYQCIAMRGQRGKRKCVLITLQTADGHEFRK